MNNKTKIHSVKYNFIMNFILTSSQFLFPLITFPYVSRVLLAAGNGRIAFASSTANYFLMVASLGIPTYGIRECARVREDKDELSKTAQELFLINAVMTTIVLMTYFVMITLVPQFRENKILFYINALHILLNCFGMNWLYQALEKYDYITVRSIAFKLISIVLMFIFVHDTSDVEIYAAITIFSTVGSNVLNFIRAHKYINFKPYRNYHFIRHMRPILVLFSQSLVVSIYTNLDTVMLGFMKTSTDVGLYHAAVKIKGLLLSLVTSLGNVLLPRMSYYVQNNLKEEFNRLAAKGINFTLFLSLPISAYFIMFSKEAILFLSGDGYLGAVRAMQFVVFAVIANGLTGILGTQILTSQGKEKFVLISVSVGALVDLLLNLLLIPRFGASGAAFATMIAEYMVLAVQVYYSRTILMQTKKASGLNKYLIGTALAFIFGVVIKLAGINSAFVALVISAIGYYGIYMVVEILLKEDFAKEILGVGLNIIKRTN